jgi:hypothetical protein
VQKAAVWLYRPATAIRVDNVTFIGTPLPPEEPTADNPPNGAMIDYFIHKPAEHIKLEVFDAQRNLVRSFSSDAARQQQRPPMPIAERWLAKPQILDKSAGMHRVVWNLAWGGESPDVNEEDYAALRGPKAAPGDYEIRLTVDGQTLTRELHVTMDPRSTATPQDLEQQVQLGRQIFAEALQSRKTLAVIHSVQKQLSDLQPKLQQHAELKASVEIASTELQGILTGAASGEMGLEKASSGLGAALRVVESSDRPVPAQAIELDHESSAAMKLALAKWNDFKAKRLPQLNQQLEGASLRPILTAGIEKELDASQGR